MDKDMVKYFIDRTDKRFDEIDRKIDTLLRFKWQIVGFSGIASVITALIIQLAKIP